MSQERVLVTGGTGFIAQHCMLALLAQGYRIRTTLRNLSREAEVRTNLKTGGAEAEDLLSFVAADLGSDAGWAEAVDGCTYVIHCASSTPSGHYATEDDWNRPAVEGNLRVLRAARDAGVKRLVLTSAFGAVGCGHEPMDRPFDENDWSNLQSDLAPYQRSKTLAEMAAWKFVKEEGNGLQMAVVNPTAVLGPALGADYSHSIRLIKNMMDGQPGSPKINSGFVDVRDVADLHVRVMSMAAANGERFLAIAGESLWLADVAGILRERMGPAASKVSTRVLPNWLVRLGAGKNPQMKAIAPMLGVNMNATSAKAEKRLGWRPRPAEDAIVATAESLIRLNLLEV
ncbi:dihydroflavonol-4-reductase [Paraburkholderia sp. GAS199]|uniref:SDR family oxidoreductase n=1 Tax=Paraburkholderia sp. GAS199 TaxID=3035126 RepID=UPI003D1A3DFC